MNRLILCALIFFFIETKAQTIPFSRTVDWSHCGYEGTIPDSADVFDVTTFGGVGDSVTDNYAFIMNAMTSLNGNRGVIYFPPGNYLIHSTVNLPDSVILRGASADSTHLIFDFGGVAGNSINISGSYGFPFTNVLSGFTKGSTSIVVVDTTGFSAGGYAEIQEDNGTWDSQPVFWADNSVGQIIRIDSVSGDTLFFNQALRINYDSSLNVQVRKFIPAKEIGIECLNMYRRDNVATGLCINIYFDHAVNCWVHGVESSQSVGSHIEADASAHLEMTGNYVHHSFAYDGVSTHGYGITLFKHTCECKLENNIMNHLRHSFSLQCGANGNVIGYNYSVDPNRSEIPSNFGADISLHGHYSYANLFEGNIVQNIMIDQTWGPSGPFNTFFRNRAELYGIIMTSATMQSDSENFVGNEITNSGPFLGNYLLAGSGHFEHGNNVLGVITPSGTTTLNDSSYYLSSRPSFWNMTSSFPSIGEPVVFGSGSIPAKARFISGTNLAACSDPAVPTSIAPVFYPEINIFPNPVSSEFTVSNPLFKGKKIILKIYNVLGEEIFSKPYINPGSSSQIRIDVSSLEKGIYLLTFSDGEKFFAANKIVKE